MLPVPSTPVQLSARAMIRAVVVAAYDAGQQHLYAWAIRPTRNAFDKVRTSASWPMSEPKVAGRYFRRVPGSSSRRAGRSQGRSWPSALLAKGCEALARRQAETEATTRAELVACFLPDLTGLARDPSAVSLPGRTISPPLRAKQET